MHQEITPDASLLHLFLLSLIFLPICEVFDLIHQSILIGHGQVNPIPLKLLSIQGQALISLLFGAKLQEKTALRLSLLVLEDLD